MRQRREELGATQLEVANSLGTALFTLARYERGEIAMSILVLLDVCRVLGKTPDELLL